MRVLIISAEVWRDDTSGGNVLSNIFSGIDAEFAQIYCNPGVPSNRLCNQYFQITDWMVLKSFLSRQPVGTAFRLSDRETLECETVGPRTPIARFYRISRILRWQILYSVRELIWRHSNWQNEKLAAFVNGFRPDVIFAPCYGSGFMLALDRFVSKLANRPTISYISDDHYSLKQFRLSPLFWWMRLSLRRDLRLTFPLFHLTYTMTDEQSAEMEEALGARMAILRKAALPAERRTRSRTDGPIRLIFAGGIYLNRWRTLGAIAQAIRMINADDINMVLDIYTGDQLTQAQKSVLDDGRSSRVRGLASRVELQSAYQSSDIALHVESFDLKNRLTTRLSFSTKIVDCLQSGCAVMAVAWSGHAGYRYLLKEDAAICVSDVKDIEDKLREILHDPSIIDDFAARAAACLSRNHDPDDIRAMLTSDFESAARLGI